MRAKVCSFFIFPYTEDSVFLNPKMNRSKEVELLQEIWANIPKSQTEQTPLPPDELIGKFLSLFHPGEFFYNFFDTRTATMEYVSPNIEVVLGYRPQEFDLGSFLNIMHPDDRPYYVSHEQRATEFFAGLPYEKLTKYKFSHDFRMMHKAGDYKRLLVQITPVHFFTEGGARTLCVFTDISYLKIQGTPRLSFIGLEGEPSFYNVDLSDELKLVSHPFTKREMEILKYTVEGKVSAEIAGMMNISRYTVDTHRKNILGKSKCATVNELIAKSIREGWV